MKVLVLGDDGRTHAFVWKLFNSSLVHELICAPGNGGTNPLVPAVPLDTATPLEVARWAFDESIDIIVPASSQALHAGLVDEVVSLHVGVCGPSQRSTILERSRCQAKEFMLRYNLPTAPGRAFTDLVTAEKYLATFPLPVMIKADHPEAGEAIYTDRYAALQGLRNIFSTGTLEGRNNGVVIEAALHGARLVLSAFTDGNTVVPLLPVRLYDRLEEDDNGAWVHGMGAHTSNSTFARRLGTYLHEKLLEPVIAGIKKDGFPYWGIIGIDCIVTNAGPRLIGLRSSMHESEAQVVLPRLEDDLLPWLQAMIAQRLHEQPAPTWTPMASVGIGLIARGYPHHFPVGSNIRGLEDLDEGILVFHSATDSSASMHYESRSNPGLAGLIAGRFTPSSGMNAGLPRTTGGMVLTIVAQGATLAGTRGRALVNAERIQFEGRTYRSDIGAKEFG